MKRMKLLNYLVTYPIRLVTIISYENNHPEHLTWTRFCNSWGYCSHFRRLITSKHFADKFSIWHPALSLCPSLRIGKLHDQFEFLPSPWADSHCCLGWRLLPSVRHSPCFFLQSKKVTLKCTDSRQSTSLHYFHYSLISWKPGRSLWLVRRPHQGANHCHCIHCRNPPQGSNKLPFTGGLVANKSWSALQAWQDRARFSILILGSKYNSRDKPGRKALLLW